jgi:hypothetical protein
MPNKTFYIPQEDVAVWEEAAKISKRRKHSVSSLLTMLLKDWVTDNTTGLAAQMGLRTGMKPPSHLIDPVQEEIDRLVADFQAQARDLIVRSMEQAKKAGESL